MSLSIGLGPIEVEPASLCLNHEDGELVKMSFTIPVDPDDDHPHGRHTMALWVGADTIREDGNNKTHDRLRNLLNSMLVQRFTPITSGHIIEAVTPVIESTDFVNMVGMIPLPTHRLQ